MEQTKFAKVIFFTPVCQSFCSQGGGGVPGQVHPAWQVPGQVHPAWQVHHPQAGTPRQVHHLQVGTPPGQVHPQAGTPTQAGTPRLAGTPRESTPPKPQCMLGYGQQAGGIHSTGMHSCYD